MIWALSHQYDPTARVLADRHYSRQKVGDPQFSPPGKKLVLVTPKGDAVWITLAQKFIDHAWKDSWNNCLFRNESSHLSSTMIREAVAASLWYFGEPPSQGLITFIDCKKIKRKRDPGRCYLRAGFEAAGWTQSGKLVLQLLPDQMPDAVAPIGSQTELFADG